MLRVCFSPVPECVVADCWNRAFPTPPRGTRDSVVIIIVVVVLYLALKLIHWLVFIFCSWVVFLDWNPTITTQRYFSNTKKLFSNAKKFFSNTNKFFLIPISLFRIPIKIFRIPISLFTHPARIFFPKFKLAPGARI